MEVGDDRRSEHVEDHHRIEREFAFVRCGFHRRKPRDRRDAVRHAPDDQGPVPGRVLKLAGAPGFEPGDGGIKIRCLTTWLRPIAAALARDLIGKQAFSMIPRRARANAGGPYSWRPGRSTAVYDSAAVLRIDAR